jgi:hypothetical protein
MISVEKAAKLGLGDAVHPNAHLVAVAAVLYDRLLRVMIEYAKMPKCGARRPQSEWFHSC